MGNRIMEVNVLYVEDEPNAREAAVEILKRIVRTVYVAENGKEGLEAFNKYNPDIVITDIRMPVMSGLDMARKIREESRNKQIIVTTAHSDTDYFLAAIDIAVDQYILKPVQRDKLIAVVGKCADHVLHEREIQKYDEEREKLILKLQETNAKVKTLSGFIPICAGCKKIRDDKGYWKQVETYISEHSEALFSHAICPECGEKIYPEYYDAIWGKGRALREAGMAKEDNIPDKSSELRQRAENMLLKKHGEAGNMLPPGVQRIFRELQVHQIELEMQNDELHRTQKELEASREKYFDLYARAPVGYVTLDEKGIILEANFTAAALLGKERSYLVKHPLTRFIFMEDQDTYNLYCKQLFETRRHQKCEVRMLKGDGTQFRARLESEVVRGNNDEPASRTMISDITANQTA